jgi:hypothetical protein
MAGGTIDQQGIVFTTELLHKGCVAPPDRRRAMAQ